MMPSSTVLSGDDVWVTVDAAVSNDLFYFPSISRCASRRGEGVGCPMAAKPTIEIAGRRGASQHLRRPSDAKGDVAVNALRRSIIGVMGS